MGKSLAELLAPYLGNAQPAATQPNAAGRVASPDFTVPPPGLRPRPSDAFVPNLGAAKSIAAGAVEPFGQLGRVMTGQSENIPMDLAGAAMGLTPIGPPGAGRALRAGAEAVEPAAMGQLREAAMMAAQPGVKANLPPPKNLLDRTWDNYTKRMTESEMLESEPAWGTAKRISEQDNVPMARGFAKIVNDWYQRKGIDKQMSEKAANEYLGSEQAKAMLRNMGITK